MQVKIANVEVEWSGNGAKKYGKAVVDYVYNGQNRQQKIMSFANPQVFKQVQELVGQTVEVEVGKNDKGFSEWKAINVGGAAPSVAGPAAASTTTRVSGSNYETKEERAARQVLIVKQSSLTAAVGTLSPGAKAALKPEEVIELAQRYADWVFEKTEEPSGFEGMSDDIPY